MKVNSVDALVWSWFVALGATFAFGVVCFVDSMNVPVWVLGVPFSLWAIVWVAICFYWFLGDVFGPIKRCLRG